MRICVLCGTQGSKTETAKGVNYGNEHRPADTHTKIIRLPLEPAGRSKVQPWIPTLRV